MDKPMPIRQIALELENALVCNCKITNQPIEMTTGHAHDCHINIAAWELKQLCTESRRRKQPC